MLLRSLRRAYVTAAACIAAALLVAFSADAGDRLKLGVFPRKPPAETISEFRGIADYLSAQTGRQVSLQVYRDYDAFERDLSAGVFDIVHFNHRHFHNTRGSAAYQIIGMNKEAGRANIRGAIFVRTESPCTSLSDLKGKKIIFGGGREAFIAYTVNKKLLRDAGLDDADYTEETALTPPSAVIALSRGVADAAAAGDMALQMPMVLKAGAHRNVRILASSGPYPHLPWAVRETLPAETREKVKQALLSLGNSREGRRILSRAGLDGIVDSRDDLYQSALRAIEEVEARR